MVAPQRMEEGSITKLIIKFSGPAIVGMIVMSVYNVVDRIYIGRGVGSLGLAGLTVGFPLMVLMMAITQLIGVGATALISIRLGEKKHSEAENVIGNALVLLFVVAVVLTILGLLFLDPLLHRFGASAKVLPYARDYMQIILLGTVFQNLSFGANNFIRAEGNPKTAMVTMLFGAIINIALDPLLIYVLDLGVRGAALATVFSQSMSLTWVLTYFLRGKSTLRIKTKYFRLNAGLVRDIVTMGTPVFFQQSLSSIVVVFLNNQLQRYGGDLAISAHGAIHSILTLFLMPIFGISQGLQPILGYNYGANKYKRVKKALLVAVLFGIMIATTGYLAIQFFPKPIVSLFSPDVELIALSAKAIRRFLLVLPIMGFTIITSNYFQAVGKPNQALFLNLARQALFFLPALYVLPRFWGLDGIWFVPPVADVFSTALTAIAIYREMRSLNSGEPNPDQTQQKNLQTEMG